MEIRLRAAWGHAPRAVLCALALVFAACFVRIAHAEGLSADAQQRVRAATFEVVQLKPDDGDVTYERALPMEQIPYQQRVDKYRSIGTAFAIAPNRFITAAHVIRVGMGSQFGPPALRDSAGEVYAIDKVIKFSQEQDFVEFSLQHPLDKLHPLATADPPPLNDPVFAVGNALGQGIVIRDGVYTSDTPEELEGRWKWLRFTAAASPGNSGGPLIDRKARVIGVVLRKSESENLNYAVPIKLVTAAGETEGVADERTNFRLPVLDATETLTTTDRIQLPKSLADFYSALLTFAATDIARGDAQLLEHNKDRLFPQSASSAQLLKEVIRSAFPRRIQEGQDRRWGTVVPKDIQTAQLDHNGYVRYGGGIFELRAPDDIKLAGLYADSKTFMDLILRSAANIRRRIGTDAVKVTSLGKAREEFVKTDSYGRSWNFKIWAVPFDDYYLVTMSLPTPEGMVSVFAAGPSGAKDVLVHRQELFSNFVWVTYEGTLPRWREFLELKAAQPQIFSKFTLDIDPGYKSVHFHSSRCDLNLTPQVVGLTEDSVLTLNFSFFKDGGSVVWDVGGLALGEGARHTNFVDVRRYQRPEPELPESFQANWAKISAGDFPFNGVASDENGGMRISAVAPSPAVSAADPANVRYALTIQNEGSPGQEALHAKLEGLEKGFKALEH
jgi:serine protease Do